MRALWFADVLRDAGLTIRLNAGWETRGLDSFDPRGVMWHHTVTRPTTADPSIDHMLAVTGSSKVKAPLCNYSTNRDGSISIICAGTANHGGTGNWKGVSGNRLFFGDEMKNLGTQATEPWVPRQLESARIAAAAILAHIGRDASWLCGHKEYATPAGRKSDPHSLDMNVERVLVGVLIQNPQSPQEDDMWQYLNIDESLVRHAWNQGWLQPKTPQTLDYFLTHLAELQEATAPASFAQDWQAFRRAVSNGIARGGAQGTPGTPGTPGAPGTSTIDAGARANAAAAHERLNKLHTV